MRSRMWVLIPALAVAAQALAGGLVEQSFDLHPGWNAIYLEVEPEQTSIETALAGLPVSSVWTWRDGYRKSQFVTDPSRKLLSVDGWFGWFPPSRPESSLNNLYHFEANRAYLIEIDGGLPQNWQIRGRPILRERRWASDSFNFVGFSVDPASPPTFGEYFAPSDAHRGQKIYEMGEDGNWREITAPYSATIQSGSGYLVYCKGDSNYQGPFVVDTGGIDGLDFGYPLNGLTLSVENGLDVDVDFRLTREAGATIPLVLRVLDDVSGAISWPVLPDGYSREVEAFKTTSMKLSVRRADLGVDAVDEVLNVSNGLGVRILVPIHVSAAPGPTAKSRASGGGFSGLWVGVARVNRVSQAQEAGTEPTATGASFPMRFILHLNSAGQVHFLKEVLEVWKNGTTTEDPDNPGFQKTETPGHYVLLTDESLIDQYTGVENRDGTSVGTRISTASYDFRGDMLEAPGSIGLTGDLDLNVVVPLDLPTNPFYHRYHPDHDNLDAEFLNFEAEAYELTRKIHWHFTATDPQATDDPDWGSDVLGGVYTEELTGLHRNPIFVSGTFRMRRVSTVDGLNE